MTTIVLVFQLLYMDWTPASEVTISQRAFNSKEECAEFINGLVADGTDTVWVDDNYAFDFVTPDNIRFVGGCYTPQEYMRLP